MLWVLNWQHLFDVTLAPKAHARTRYATRVLLEKLRKSIENREKVTLEIYMLLRASMASAREPYPAVGFTHKNPSKI